MPRIHRNTQAEQIQAVAGTTMILSTGNQKQRLQKKVLWGYYYTVNKLKSFFYYMHCFTGCVKAQQEWCEYLTKAWENNGGISWDADHIIHMMVIPFCKWEYIGETSLGLRDRMITHIQQTCRRAGRQQLYAKVREMGIQKGIWLPVKTWSNPIPKVTRLYHEALHIWQRNPKLNTLGTKSFRDKKQLEGELLVPKRRRFKLVLRLRELARRQEGQVKKQWTLEDKKRTDLAEVKSRGEIFALVAQMTRRPIKKTQNYEEFASVRKIRELPDGRLKTLMRSGYNYLDRVNRSIFMKNMSLVMEGQKRCMLSAATIAAPVCGVKETKNELKNVVRKMGHRWGRFGVLVFVKLNLISKPGRSLMSIYGNTTAWGSKKKEEMP